MPQQVINTAGRKSEILFWSADFQQAVNVYLGPEVVSKGIQEAAQSRELRSLSVGQGKSTNISTEVPQSLTEW